jgi:hypothetical protein
MRMANQRYLPGNDLRVPLQQRFQRPGWTGNKRSVDFRSSPQRKKRSTHLQTQLSVVA